MAGLAYVLGPVLVLVASWSLLRAYDQRERRHLRVALLCLAAAVAVTAAGIALDAPPASPPSPTGVPQA